jgi:hypothetical protein
MTGEAAGGRLHQLGRGREIPVGVCRLAMAEIGGEDRKPSLHLGSLAMGVGQGPHREGVGTHCASAGVSLRTLQEWMGHRDFKTTLIYADYAPSPHEAELVERAFNPPAGSAFQPVDVSNSDRPD